MFLFITCISIYSCGPSAEEISNKKKFEEEENAKAAYKAYTEAQANNPIRFDKYLKKMQGTWIFQQTQPCVELSKSKFGLTETNERTGVCQKMKIIINGNSYKVYLEDFGVINNMLVRKDETNKPLPLDYDLGTELPGCEGKIELRQFDNENNPNKAIVICRIDFNYACTEISGTADERFNHLYWDDSKEALNWTFHRTYGLCDYNGYCNRVK